MLFSAPPHIRLFQVCHESNHHIEYQASHSTSGALIRKVSSFCANLCNPTVECRILYCVILIMNRQAVIHFNWFLVLDKENLDGATLFFRMEKSVQRMTFPKFAPVGARISCHQFIESHRSPSRAMLVMQ
jgi:hypothetical protein